MKNHTSLPTFILLGLTDDPPMQVLIFTLLFASYTLNVTGNLIIIIITLVDSHLKTAMCFFLKNFSFLEALFTTVCIPRFLYSLSTEDKTISYNACFSQIFFIFTFTATEFFLLAIMSYDCYVAICKPSHYATIMNSRVCGGLVICCWIAGCLVIFPPASLGLELEFCDSNIIDHFLCDASCVKNLLFRHMVPRTDGFYHCCVDCHWDISVCVSVLYIHHQDYHKVAFGSAKNEGLFYLLFSPDCGFYHLWKLYFHLCQTFSKG